MSNDTLPNSGLHAIVTGRDEFDFASALTEVGVHVDRIDDIVTGDRLRGVGIETANFLIVTEADDATAIPLAREQNPTVRIVVYTNDSLPEFAKPIADYIVDPDLMSPAAIADALV